MAEKLAAQLGWLTNGWQIYKQHKRSLIKGSFIYFSPYALSIGFPAPSTSSDLLWLVQEVTVIVLTAGWGLFCLNLVRGDEPKIATIFSGVTKIKTVLAVSILYFLISVGGLFLLVIPGVVWALKYGFSTYLVMDKNLSAREALRTSGLLTMGHKNKLLSIFALFMLLRLPSFLFFYSFQRISDGETLSGWGFFAIGLTGLIAEILIFTPWFGGSWASAYEELAQKHHEDQSMPLNDNYTYA